MERCDVNLSSATVVTVRGKFNRHEADISRSHIGTPPERHRRITGLPSRGGTRFENGTVAERSRTRASWAAASDDTCQLPSCFGLLPYSCYSDWGFLTRMFSTAEQRHVLLIHDS